MNFKINLYLMTYKGYLVLKSITKDKLDEFIGMVIIGEDRSVQEDFSEEIIKICKDFGIEYCLRKNEKQYDPTEFSIAISWRWLINENTKLIVLHDSILPNYRGFAPLVNQLISEEPVVGVTAIFASNEYDRGDIIQQRRILIKYPIKINKAIELLSLEYADLVNSIISKLSKNKQSLSTFPQDETLASYSLWRDDDDYKIDWSKSAKFIKRFIDSVGFPYKGASSSMKNRTIRILDAIAIEDVKIINRDVGKIIFFDDIYPVIVCGFGLLKIKEAVFEDCKESIFPLKSFRIRFT